MLAPDVRTVAMDLLRPPAGYRLDRAALTTYSLDLDVLLALPLAVLAHSEKSVDELLHDPLLLLEAMRQSSGRVHVFVDEGGIAIPPTARALYALLESSVHPVRAPNGGAFHPKVWMIRFLDAEERPLLRVAVLSRNLTFDRCWDLLLSSEAKPERRLKPVDSRPLAELLRALPDMALRKLPEELLASLNVLAEEVGRTPFPSPDGFNDSISFQALGLPAKSRKPWQPGANGNRLLAVAPFVNATALSALADASTGPRVLVSRQEALDALSEACLADWDEVHTLSEHASGETDDDLSHRPSGLHAKAVVIEHGHQATWHLGSANLTAAAFSGTNVEVIARLNGPKGRVGSGKGVGIDTFLDGGFRNLCQPYLRTAISPEDERLVASRAALVDAQRRLLNADLNIACEPCGKDEWQWALRGQVDIPAGVTVAAWPITLAEDQAVALELPMLRRLPLTRLTSFVAFRLSVDAAVEDVRFVLFLPAEGIPEGRLNQVLRTLIDTPERFLQFLRALLGGLEGLMDWIGQRNGSGAKTNGHDTWNATTLLEDLVRVASRDPKRLEPARRLIEDLRGSTEGREIVPDDLHALWMTVDHVVASNTAPASLAQGADR